MHIGHVHWSKPKTWLHLAGVLHGSVISIGHVLYKTFPEYTEYYDTQTTPVIDPYDVNNTLLSAVISHVLSKGSDLSDCIKDATLNSLLGVMLKLAKQCRPNKKYAETIGTPEATVLKKPLSLNKINTFIPEAKEIVSQQILKMGDDLRFILAYDFLSNYLGYDGQNCFIINDDKSEVLIYQYKETAVSTSNNHLAVVLTRQIQVGRDGRGQPVYGLETLALDTGIDLSQYSVTDDYVVIGYKYDDIDDLEDIEEHTAYYVYNVNDNTNDIITAWYNQGHLDPFPSFYLRSGYKPITKDIVPEYYKACDEVFKKLHLDYEDLVNNVNAIEDTLKSTKNQETADQNYKDNLKNIPNICLTFALDIKTNDQRVMQYIYEFFKFMYQTSGINSNSISYEHLAYQYTAKWDKIDYKKIKGKKTAIKHYTIESTTRRDFRTIYPGGVATKIPIDVSVLRICKQISEDEYVEITVEGYKYTSYNLGKAQSHTPDKFTHTKSYTIAEIKQLRNEEIEEDTGECLIPILPVIIRSKFGGARGNDLLAIGMRLVFNVYSKTKKKWYATTWFAVVRVVVSLVIIIVTWGTATPVVAGLNALVQLAIQILIVLAIKLAVKYICKIFHVEGAALAVINTVTDLACMYICMNVSSIEGIAVIGATQQLITSVALNLSSMIINGTFNLDGFANALTGIAGAGIATSMNQALSELSEISRLSINASIQTMYSLSMSPSFMYALDNKKFSDALMQGALAVATSIVTATLFTGKSTNNNNITYSEHLKIGDTSILNLTPEFNFDPFKTLTEGITNINSAKANTLKERNKSYAKATQDIVARNENLMKSTHLLGLKNNQQVLDIIMAKQLSSGTLDIFRLQTLA